MAGAVTDSGGQWQNVMRAAVEQPWFKVLAAAGLHGVHGEIYAALADLQAPRQGRGTDQLQPSGRPLWRPEWYLDERLPGVCNHGSREHMPLDIHRYLFASAFAKVQGFSPRLRDFPASLRPEHLNVTQALGHEMFADRFRVQLPDAPATTVMSHLAKDGHYFIHPDPAQARSLTVREAARLQTFPDNYFFCGNRSEQYTQVGNAVPPLLARQIAGIVAQVLTDAPR